MMSPMALRRTMSRLSNRGVPAGRENDSVILVVAQLVAAQLVATRLVGATAIRAASRFFRLQSRTRTNNLAGRVILRITYDDNPASAGFDFVALGYALRRVVSALGMKIRTN